ncbi:MAG: NAD(P)H-binding protein [Nocardioides sp.]|nr:NAD(P)H-binding protein [Nocardioides sp.]
MRIAVSGASGTVGRHVVNAAERRDHEVVRLSRADGVDLTHADTLAGALQGADVVIDACNASTIEEGPAREFFTTVAGNLQREGAQQGVERIVTLSIVGIDDADFGYCRAKVGHERAAASGTVPHTIVRASQLHELPGQLIGLTRHDHQASVFDAESQTVAASSVAEALVDVAERSPGERGSDLAGPEPAANLVDLGRAFIARRGVDLQVQPDTETMSGIPAGGLLPGSDVTVIGPTFADWLDSPDAAALPI